MTMRASNFGQSNKGNSTFTRVSLSSLYFPAVLGALGMLVFIFSWAYIVQDHEVNIDKNTRIMSAEKRVNDVASLLSSTMNVRLNLTSSLRAFVITRKEFTPEEFDSFASMLKQDLSAVMSLQLAPNGIVTYLTDIDGNQKAIGHDLLADPQRRIIAKKSILEHSYIISGPVDLVQGGRAVIARRPIYLRDPITSKETFWGFATVLIDIEALLGDTLVETLRKDFEVAIRGKNGLGEKGELFWGQQATFDSALAFATVILPNASWQIAIAQHAKYQPSGLVYSWWYWLVTIIIGVTSAIITYSIIDRPRQLNRKISTATATLRQEIRHREDAENKVRHMALHDVLTDLPNRRLFGELAKHALLVANRGRVPFAMLFIDIDGFKAVNDSLGHAFGDWVLQRIAQRLHLQVREADIVARFGGDEFVILLAENCNAERAQQVCEKIIDSISQPFEHNNQQVSVGASIGIAIYQEHGTTIEQLLKKSDAAMYEAKNSGKNCYRLATSQ